jgi:hypothetical protein
MDIFSFVILFFVIIFTSQYNLNFFSLLFIILFSVFNDSLWNLVLVFEFVFILFTMNQLNSTWMSLSLIVVAVIIIIHFINKKKSSDSGGANMEDFAKLFGGQ